MSINFLLHTDEPCSSGADLCHLGMESTAKVVASIASVNPGPMTIGLLGPWGSGKTTVLDRVASICEDSVVLRLNPWEHERDVDPLVGLLGALLAQLKEINDRPGPKLNFIDEAIVAVKTQYWKAVGQSALLAKAALMLGGASLEATGDPSGKVVGVLGGLLPTQSEIAEAVATPGKSVRQKLEDALKGQKVIVLVDDLDRCRPENALAVLEALKHLLWVKGIVFVIALDTDVLIKHLDKLHADALGDPIKGIGERYLQKLIQAKVPVVHRDEEKFLSYVEAIIDEAVRHNQEWLPGKQEMLPIRNLVAASAARQPREAKRLINSIVIDWALMAYERNA